MAVTLAPFAPRPAAHSMRSKRRPVFTSRKGKDSSYQPVSHSCTGTRSGRATWIPSPPPYRHQPVSHSCTGTRSGRATWSISHTPPRQKMYILI
eukprot:5336020-Pyramimonas_sp.AAC.1